MPVVDAAEAVDTADAVGAEDAVDTELLLTLVVERVFEPLLATGVAETSMTPLD